MKTKQNLLIVCEGSHTEPEYFHQLRDRLIELGVDYSVTIRPKPPTESEAERKSREGANPAARPGAVRRQLKDVPVSEEEFMVEEQYQAQPVRYVREAQQGLIDKTFEEVWAVYDRNGHSAHFEAVALAADTTHPVHIAFSSIAFEHWLLLHFEYSETAFIKSECRQQREVFHCGRHIHELDCHGERCVAGYMKEQGYITPNKNIKELGYKELSPRMAAALAHARRLRRTQRANNPGVPDYQLNPVTTVDQLALKLLMLPLDLVWINHQPIAIDHLRFSWLLAEGALVIRIHNEAGARFIMHPDHVILLDVYGNKKEAFERWIMPAKQEQVKVISVPEAGDFVPVYVAFKKQEGQYLVAEIE